LKADSENPEEVFFGVMGKRLRHTRVIFCAGLAFGCLSLGELSAGRSLRVLTTNDGRNSIWLVWQDGRSRLLFLDLCQESDCFSVIMMGSVIWELGRFQVTAVTHKFGVTTVGRTLLPNLRDRSKCMVRICV